MNTYNLSRDFFSFSYEKKECKAIHAGLYFFIVDLNNRLAWKNEFGLPTHDTMEALSIGNKNTYLTTLRELQEWGFIRIVSEAKNQYQSCIISLCCSNNEPALDTALDTALIRHHTQHCSSTGHGTASSTDTIYKQINKETNKQINKETKKGESPFSEKNLEKIYENLQDEDIDEFEKFYSYWTEKNMQEKERWESQEFFDIEKRFISWKEKSKTFGTQKKEITATAHGTTPPQTFFAQEAMQREQLVEFYKKKYTEEFAGEYAKNRKKYEEYIAEKERETRERLGISN